MDAEIIAEAGPGSLFARQGKVRLSEGKRRYYQGNLARGSRFQTVIEETRY